MGGRVIDGEEMQTEIGSLGRWPSSRSRPTTWAFEWCEKGDPGGR